MWVEVIGCNISVVLFEICYLCCIKLHICTRWTKKTRLFLRVDNFVMFIGRKTFNMSKVTEFCLEKKQYLHLSAFKYSLPDLYKS